VGHDGGVAAGDYCQTLDLTDIATTWTETMAVRNKAQVRVFEALQKVRKNLPFRCWDWIVITAQSSHVVFELGLFIGRLGRERCFIVMPRDISDFHLPSDLLGTTPVTFDSNRKDEQAALGPVANKILRQIQAVGCRSHASLLTGGTGAKSLSLADDRLTVWVIGSYTNLVEKERSHAEKLVSRQPEFPCSRMTSTGGAAAGVVSTLPISTELLKIISDCSRPIGSGDLAARVLEAFRTLAKTRAREDRTS
jgi:Predicted nucleotide-binding protein containing TIR-like domain